ncbi:PilZ domain-containing protein [Cohnella silvisoli]|uniref:PilZ domain-containing protein n=1 Tax=Cohnella silvisoli TaxID=2873699 RepID=A0ABV1KXF9_9BACL|nr:PilZ domain-containing protein [Cohnella silvisoli]
MGKRIGDPVTPAKVEKKGTERRKKTRLPLDIPLMMSIYQWEGDGGFSGQSVNGSLRDLSEDGIQIESEFPLEKDMFIVIHFLQKSDIPPVTGRIIRIERNNGTFKYGCMLTALPLYQRLQLQEYIASQTK